ncbi:MAG: ADP-ribosylation factor family protein [Candidatus Odinarchaeota archaeon]
MKNLFTKRAVQAQITLCGLKAAGKTAIMNYLLVGEPVETFPTTGINYERIRLHSSNYIDVYDLPGQESLRHLWDKYITSTDLLVFVIDSADHSSIDEAKVLFWNVYNVLSTKTAPPFCVLVNKQDLKNHLTTREIIAAFRLQKIDLHEWQAIGTSAITGEGIVKAFQWIYKKLAGEQPALEIHIHDIIILDSTSKVIASRGFITADSVLNRGFLPKLQELQSGSCRELDRGEVSSIHENKRACGKKCANDGFIAIIIDQDDDERIAFAVLEKLAGAVARTPWHHIPVQEALDQFIKSSLAAML